MISLRAHIDFLFNRWKKHEVAEVFIDEATNIPEETWKSLLRRKDE